MVLLATLRFLCLYPVLVTRSRASDAINTEPALTPLLTFELPSEDKIRYGHNLALVKSEPIKFRISAQKPHTWIVLFDDRL
jgi:hypothetical protein